jgi:phosphotriesterase-related protein
MAEVQTVRGPIDSTQLGTTLMHEHFFVLDTEILQNYPEDWGAEEKRIADAVTRLNELKARGSISCEER